MTILRWWKGLDGVDRNAIKIIPAAFLFVFLCVFLCVLAGMFLISQAECLATTADIGFPRRWSYWGGCQIEVVPGQWIPLDSYRYTGLD